MKKFNQILNEAKLGTRNKAWGLFGQLGNRQIKKPAATFMVHVEALAKVLKIKIEVARDMMDSKVGRHYADSLADAILQNPTPLNLIKHPWIKREYQAFKKEYDPVEFAASLGFAECETGFMSYDLVEEVEVAYTDLKTNKQKRKKFKDEKAMAKWIDKADVIVHSFLKELSREGEWKKAQFRLDSFAERAKSQEKLSNMINLRTRKMKKLDKVQIWADVLEDNNFHDESRIADERAKELQKNEKADDFDPKTGVLTQKAMNALKKKKRAKKKKQKFNPGKQSYQD